MVKKRKKSAAKKEAPLLKLDLACGDNKREGYFGVDITKTASVDQVVDLLKFPWPWGDDSVDAAHCAHFVEHIPHRTYGSHQLPDPFFLFFDELWRVLKVGAQCEIWGPYYSSMRCWQDPTHQRALSEASFLYLNKGWRDLNKLSHYQVGCDFDFGYNYAIDPTWGQRAEDARTFAIRHYHNVVNDVQILLTKRGPGQA